MRRRILASVGGAALPYLRRVAYLESTGYEYIDLGLKGNEKLDIEADCQALGSAGGTSGSWRVFGDFSDTSKSMTAIIAFPYSSNWRRGSFSSVVATQSGARIVIRNSPVGYYVNGSLVVATPESSQFITNHSMYLFAAYWSGFNASTGKGRIFDFKIREDNALVMRLVPVLDLSGRPAMYDEVSGQFFYNASSTGEFTWGELET